MNGESEIKKMRETVKRCKIKVIKNDKMMWKKRIKDKRERKRERERSSFLSMFPLSFGL
jgi:hypothetical protein